MRIVSREEMKTPRVDKDGTTVFQLLGSSPQVGASKGFSLILQTIPVGVAGPEHYHLEEEECYIVARGLGRVFIDGKPNEMKPGTIVLISPKEKHFMANAGDETLEFFAVCAPPWKLEDSYPREH